MVFRPSAEVPLRGSHALLWVRTHRGTPELKSSAVYDRSPRMREGMRCTFTETKGTSWRADAAGSA